MKFWHTLLIAMLSLAAPSFVPSGVARADEYHVENGGVIILHAVYQFCSGGCDLGTFIFIAPDTEVEDASLRFSNESGVRVVRLSGHFGSPSFDAQVMDVGHDRLSGRLIPSGQTVVIASESYARSVGWL